MPLARTTYAGDGSTNSWAFSWAYLSTEHVKLFIDGVEDATFTFISSASVAATITPANGAVVEVRRVTPSSTLVYAVPESGSIRHSTLNNQTLQALYVAEESADSYAPQDGTVFTPGIAFGGGTTGITYTNQDGRWQQVGKVVFVQISITVSNKGSSTGALTITGLPAAAHANAFGELNVSQVAASGSNDWTNPFAKVVAGGTTLTVWKDRANATQVAADDNQFTTGDLIMVTGFYEAA